MIFVPFGEGGANHPHLGEGRLLKRGRMVNARGAKLWSACSLLPLSFPQACLRDFQERVKKSNCDVAP
jgi:hypothetical protein